MWILDFLNFLDKHIGLVTLFVGGIAILLYIKQKRDHKRDAAGLILQEIRYAEAQIKTYTPLGQYPLAVKLLPTNSWHSNIHLFIKSLKETEIDLISKFYSQAKYIDSLISKISDIKINTGSGTTIIPLSPVAPSSTPVASAPLIIDPTLTAQALLIEVSKQVEPIYNTPAVEKLRTISEARI